MNKILKFFTKTIIILIFIIITLFGLDFVSYDDKYMNRSTFFFHKQNLNSRYSDKLFNLFSNTYYNFLYNFVWKENTSFNRADLPKEILITSSGKFTKSTQNVNIKNLNNWTRSHGNNSSTKFSYLDTINTDNVKNLKIAWIYNSKDGSKGIQANPIAYNGYIYFPTPGNSIVCLNGENGKLIWKYKGETSFISRRGLVLHEGKNPKLYFTDTNRLISVNALTGEPNKNFGKNGKIKIKKSVVTPVIFQNTIIVATWYPSIEVYDLDSGKPLWKYYLKEKGEKFEGGNPWGGISLDEKRGILYLTTGNPDGHFIGTKRPGENKYSNSVIAIDLVNKKILWDFQETNHDIWNLDLPAPPILTSVINNGNKIDVVVNPTKRGNTLILDRLTGEPIFDYKKILVPASKLKGEYTSTYQKVFELPEPFTKSKFELEDVFSFDKEEQEKLKKIAKKTNFGIFEPYEFGTKNLQYNFHGGAEWMGASVDPEEGIMYVNSNNILWVTEIFKKKSSIFKHIINDMAPYAYTNKRFVDKNGFPATKPPWGKLTALDLNTGKIIWDVPLGDYQFISDKYGNTGTENFGGAISTKGGLIFISGTLDKKIRAFDKRTGEELWSYKLPYIGSAPPTTYEINNIQYILIPSTGGRSLSNGYPELVENGDAFIAFALK